MATIVRASLSVIGGCLLVGNLAVTTGGAQTVRDVVLPAPVGHRQPTTADLPPRVLRDEDIGRAPQRAPSGNATAPRAAHPNASSRNEDFLWPRGENLQLCREC